jgi:hypothetical protein
MSTPASPLSRTRISLAQDIRRTFAPGLRFGAIQGAVPIAFLLVFILFVPTSNFGHSALGFDFASPIAQFYYRAGNVIGFLPLLATGGIDILASWRVTRRTHSVRAGILTCLWANVWFLVGGLVTNIGAVWYDQASAGRGLSLLSGYVFSGSFLSDSTYYVVYMFFPAIVLSFLCGGIGGRFGLRQAPTYLLPGPEAILPTSATQLAAQNRLGTPIRSHSSSQPSRVLATGVGTIVVVILLFVLQRFVLHVTGGDLFVDAVAAIAGAIATINQAYRRQGQQVVVYQNGLLVPSAGRRLAAIRWEEIDLHQSRLGENGISLVTQSGFRVALPSTFADFGALKATISAHMQQAGVRSRQQ